MAAAGVARQIVPLFRHRVAPVSVIASKIGSRRGLFWSSRRDPFSEMRTMLREMEHQAEHFERMLGNNLSSRWPSFFRGGRHVPVLQSGAQQALQQPEKYRIGVDLGDYQPENVKVSLKGRVLTIEAKEKQEGEGYYAARETSHQLTLPDDVDVENLSSILESDGVLRIEATRKGGQEKLAEPKKIPIEKGEESTTTGSETGSSSQSS